MGKVDDLLIFADSERRTLKRILKTLETYEKWSGQATNKEKSALFLSNKITSSRRQGLLRLIGFVEGMLLTKYLGAPLISGLLISWMLDSLVQKI